ncbi:protease complex subunit PrcB family protein [Flavobacterium sp. RNTU_13]|uniref:protease complex subunit PrcB family protein n=1 Tax=Flavobacterium sp. RNTU_13 TaxID=3375145 RepID=UPI003985E8D8
MKSIKVLLALLTVVVVVACGSTKNASGFTILKQEATGGATTESTVLVNTKSELTALYKQLNVATLPKVDFKKQSVAVLFMGQKPTGGYAITVTEVAIDKEKKAMLTVARSKPDGMAVTMITQPYCVVLIPKANTLEIK